MTFSIVHLHLYTTTVNCCVVVVILNAVRIVAVFLVVYIELFPQSPL